MAAAEPIVVLDDDPTGTQAVHDVPVLLRWPPAALADAVAAGAPAVHLLTNVRAFPPEEAERITADAARAALRAAPGARIVLRGDSTLRGHLGEEIRAVQAVQGERVVLLVPALPAAGRVTRGGVHLLVRDGKAVALHETEYARDGDFAYASARLLEWAQQRTAGLLPAERGVEVGLPELRERGGDAVRDALLAAAPPAACVPDVEDVADLERIAEGLRAAEAAGARVLVRCAPTFAGVLAGNLASGEVAPPEPGPGGVLLVCGSYVSATTRQLEHLAAHRGARAIELDPLALADDAEAPAAVARAAQAARAAIAAEGLAVVATARERPESTRTLDAGLRIARNLASVVPAVAPGVVVAKGGITSAVTLQDGVGVDGAWVVGPLLPGVALWRAGEVGYVVVPGNVGDDGLLTELVGRFGL